MELKEKGVGFDCLGLINRHKEVGLQASREAAEAVCPEAAKEFEEIADGLDDIADSLLDRHGNANGARAG